MIQSNYDKTVTVRRLVPIEGTQNERQEYADLILGLACNIQPFDESYSQNFESGVGKDWLMFCDVADVLEHDQVVDGDDVYEVVGVESYVFQAEPRHMEVKIRRYQSSG